MKRCPECMRDYADETLNFCLDDGSALLDGPAVLSNEATAIFPRFGVPSSGGISAFADSGSGRTKIFSNAANSIAVLPFVNISADAENEFFCDGLAEELLNALT